MIGELYYGVCDASSKPTLDGLLVDSSLDDTGGTSPPTFSQACALLADPTDTVVAYAIGMLMNPDKLDPIVTAVTGEGMSVNNPVAATNFLAWYKYGSGEGEVANLQEALLDLTRKGLGPLKAVYPVPPRP